MRKLLFCISLAVLMSSPVLAEQSAEASRPNILLIIGDDMGNETLSCYGLSEDPAKTPTLDDLCASGVRFDNFWSQAACSPTRATMITGRYATRTGVGRPTGDKEAQGYFPETLPKPASAPAEPPPRTGRRGPQGGEDAPADYGLPLNEFTLPMAFKVNPELGYATAAIGKWHLADRRNGWEEHPNIVGFDHFSGLIRGFPDSYFTWNKVVNGEWSLETGYAPDDKTDDAIAWIGEQGDAPWFLWMAFNLPHTPTHLPPENLWRSDWSHIDPQTAPRPGSLDHFNAMLEALDAEIERILDSMPPDVRENTYIIFMGDNGSGGRNIRPPIPRGRAKGSVYQGGVNVPLFVTGPGVATGASGALVNSTDMFLTIMEMAGIDPADTVPEQVQLDSVSFMPYLIDPEADSLRTFTYADRFSGNFAGIPDAQYAVRNQEYKLVNEDDGLQFYNLFEDPFEENDLLQGHLSEREQASYDELTRVAAEIRSGR
jgi:arylsulfatase A-like enzyme